LYRRYLFLFSGDLGGPKPNPRYRDAALKRSNVLIDSTESFFWSGLIHWTAHVHVRPDGQREGAHRCTPTRPHGREKVLVNKVGEDNAFGLPVL